MSKTEGLATLDLRQQQYQTNRFYMVVFWLTTLAGLAPFVLASYLQWVPFPFGPFLLFFGLYLVLGLLPTAMFLARWRPEWVSWVASLAITVTWIVGGVAVPNLREVWGIWLIAPVFSTLFLDASVTAAAVVISAAACTLIGWILPPAIPTPEYALAITLANVAIIAANGAAVLVSLWRMASVLNALRHAAQQEETLAKLDRTLNAVREASGALQGVTRAIAEQSSQARAFTQGALVQAVGSLSEAGRTQASAVESTAQGLTQLTRTVQDVAAGAQDQAQKIAQANAVVSETTRDAEAVAHIVADVSQSARENAAAADAGSKQVDDNLGSATAVQSRLSQIETSMNTLGSRSEQIGQVVTTVRAIADQTNLLALNAAIEAARAGEQGRGFAVVADEVRRLAERSAQSTMEVAALIGEIQSEIKTAVADVTSAAALSVEGAQQASAAREALHAVSESAGKVLAYMNEISQRTRKMEQGHGGLLSLMADLSAYSEESAAAAEEMNATAESLSALTAQTAASAQGAQDAIVHVEASVAEMGSLAEGLAAQADALEAVYRGLARTVRE